MSTRLLITAILLPWAPFSSSQNLIYSPFSANEAAIGSFGALPAAALSMTTLHSFEIILAPSVADNSSSPPVLAKDTVSTIATTSTTSLTGRKPSSNESRHGMLRGGGGVHDDEVPASTILGHRALQSNIHWNKKYQGAKLKNWAIAGTCILVILATCCNIWMLCSLCCLFHPVPPLEAASLPCPSVKASHGESNGSNDEDNSTLETVSEHGGNGGAPIDSCAPIIVTSV